MRLENPYQDLAAVGIALQDNDAFIAELGAAARAGAYNASKSADPTQVELHELADAEMRSVSRTIEFLVNKYKQEQESNDG